MIPTRHPPKLDYCGLTIVLSNPSRFDKTELISGNGGRFFSDECLRPDINRWMCDIRLASNRSELMAGTKCVLLLGEQAMKLWTGSKHSIGEQRGCPLNLTWADDYKHIPAIASFIPQDAVDMQGYERSLNPSSVHVDEEEESHEDEGSEKQHGKTSRSNYRFWLKADVKKCIGILNNNGNLPKENIQAEYILYPDAITVIETLRSTKSSQLYIDIETDTELNLRCFAFSFGKSGIVYIVPILDHNYLFAYSSYPEIMRALAIAFRDNEVIAHNGAAFDFLVFALKYKIAVGWNLYDTMIAQHRCYPLVEKSLGHCVSLWTHEPYHKDEGNFAYRTLSQAEQLWKYCGKDVYTMILVREAIDKYAKTVPGLEASIKQANESIRPYLTCMLQGIRYRKDLLEARVAENDKLMEQYLRIMSVMTGPEVEPLISNQKCARYFHGMLGYDVVARSGKTKAPSLAEKHLLKLHLKYKNPVIPVLLKYRQTQKETGALQFKPWKE